MKNEVQEILPALPLERSIQIFTDQARDAVVSRRMFKELFEDSAMGRERDFAMLKIGRHFFGWLNLAMLDYVLLQAARLLDPSSTTKIDRKSKVGQRRWNASCTSIRERIMDQSLRAKLDAVGLEDFLPHIKQARNSLLAHPDEETIAIGEPVGGFPAEVGDRFYTGLQKYVDLLHGGPWPLQNAMIINDVHNLIQVMIKSSPLLTRGKRTKMIRKGLNKRNGGTEET